MSIYHTHHCCHCYLKERARKGDWEIAKLVGIATYAQLLDSAPGLFEPIADVRNNGNSASSLTSFNNMSIEPTFMNKLHHKCIKNLMYIFPNITQNDKIPAPPNLVSTILADEHMTAEQLKCLLFDAVDGINAHPILEPLIHSSTSYNKPELTLGQIFIIFMVLTIIITIFVILFFLIASKISPNILIKMTPTRSKWSFNLTPRTKL